MLLSGEGAVPTGRWEVDSNCCALKKEQSDAVRYPGRSREIQGEVQTDAVSERGRTLVPLTGKGGLRRECATSSNSSPCSEKEERRGTCRTARAKPNWKKRL